MDAEESTRPPSGKSEGSSLPAEQRGAGEDHWGTGQMGLPNMQCKMSSADHPVSTVITIIVGTRIYVGQSHLYTDVIIFCFCFRMTAGHSGRGMKIHVAK